MFFTDVSKARTMSQASLAFVFLSSSNWGGLKTSECSGESYHRCQQNITKVVTQLAVSSGSSSPPVTNQEILHLLSSLPAQRQDESFFLRHLIN